MTKYYQELLNECIDLTENKRVHKHMLSTLATMKYKLRTLKGGKRYAR